MASTSGTLGSEGFHVDRADHDPLTGTGDWPGSGFGRPSRRSCSNRARKTAHTARGKLPDCRRPRERCFSIARERLMTVHQSMGDVAPPGIHVGTDANEDLGTIEGPAVGCSRETTSRSRSHIRSGQSRFRPREMDPLRTRGCHEDSSAARTEARDSPFDRSKGRPPDPPEPSS